MVKSYENSLILPRIEPPHKLNVVLNLAIKENAKVEKNNNESNLEKAPISTNQVLAEKEAKVSDTFAATNKVEEESGLLKIGSLSINPKKAGLKPVGGGGGAAAAVDSGAPAPAPAPETLTAKLVDVVTVGSMPVKVNGFANSVGLMTFGTIPLDAGALNIMEAGFSANAASRKG